MLYSKCFQKMEINVLRLYKCQIIDYFIYLKLLGIDDFVTSREKIIDWDHESLWNLFHINLNSFYRNVFNFKSHHYNKRPSGLNFDCMVWRIFASLVLASELLQNGPYKICDFWNVCIYNLDWLSNKTFRIIWSTKMVYKFKVAVWCKTRCNIICDL